jgi:adenylate cyclase class 2
MENIEVELKFPLLNIDLLVQKLKSIAELDGEGINQKDTYYLPAHKNFLEKNPISEWLRLRESEKDISINYKNWHNDVNVQAVSCDEFESKIEDVLALKNILERLDFKELIVVDKNRTTYKYNDCEIAIDSVKDLGELNAELGEQIFEGYPHLLLKNKNLL